MNPDERRRRIAALLADTPDASQRAIAAAVGCSQATVLRDIAKLRGDDSVIHLIHPGAEEVSPPVTPQVSRGAALVERLRAEMDEQDMIPTSGEEELLLVAKDLADRIALLQNIVAADGERRTTKDGRVFAHPFLSEIRQSEAALARVIAGIQTMAAPVKNPAKQRAAQARWRVHNRQRAGETGGA